MSLNIKEKVQGNAKSVALVEVSLECMIYIFVEDALESTQRSLALRNTLEWSHECI